VIGTFADKASAKEASHPNDVYLKAFCGTSSERFEYLRYRVFSGTSCTSAGASQRNLYRLLKTAYQEAKPLAVTKVQQRILSFMRANVLDTWLALPKNAPRNVIRKHGFRRASGRISNEVPERIRSHPRAGGSKRQWGDRARHACFGHLECLSRIRSGAPHDA